MDAREKLRKIQLACFKQFSQVGFEYIEETSLLSGLTTYAEEEEFNQDCLLNSPLRKSQACVLKDQGYDLKETAER